MLRNLIGSFRLKRFLEVGRPITFDSGFNVLEAYNKFVISKLLWIARNYFSLLNIQPQKVAGVIFFECFFFLTDWFQYRPQRRYHFEWDASSRTWQVCRGSYWNKWPCSEGVLSGEGVYGILVQTDFCFTTADTTWLHYDWYVFPKFTFLTSMRLGGKLFLEYNKLIILSPFNVVSTIQESLQLW